MANDVGLDDISAAMKGFNTEHWKFSICHIPGPNGEKLIGLELIDPLRDGQASTFSVNVPENASHEEVKSKVRSAFRKYFLAHPVTRGARTF